MGRSTLLSSPYHLDLSHHNASMLQKELPNFKVCNANKNDHENFLSPEFSIPHCSCQTKKKLVGGFNPSEKYARQNRNLPQNRG